MQTINEWLGRKPGLCFRSGSPGKILQKQDPPAKPFPETPAGKTGI